MFISHTYKILFFEVPRTGSRSITKALTQLDPRSPTAVIRAVKRNLYHYHVYDQALVDKQPHYAVIAVHRNPFERIRSHYKYRKQYGNPDELKRFSFEQYVRWVCEGELPFDIGPAMLDKPICELLPFAAVDHWLAYDQLNTDWLRVRDTLQIDLPELPHINQSNREFNAKSAYTPELASMMVDRFAEDFSQFNYATDSWQTK